MIRYHLANVDWLSLFLFCTLLVFMWLVGSQKCFCLVMMCFFLWWLNLSIINVYLNHFFLDFKIVFLAIFVMCLFSNIFFLFWTICSFYFFSVVYCMFLISDYIVKIAMIYCQLFLSHQLVTVLCLRNGQPYFSYIYCFFSPSSFMGVS